MQWFTRLNRWTKAYPSPGLQRQRQKQTKIETTTEIENVCQKSEYSLGICHDTTWHDMTWHDTTCHVMLRHVTSFHEMSCHEWILFAIRSSDHTSTGVVHSIYSSSTLVYRARSMYQSLPESWASPLELRQSLIFWKHDYCPTISSMQLVNLGLHVRSCSVVFWRMPIKIIRINIA